MQPVRLNQYAGRNPQGPPPQVPALLRSDSPLSMQHSVNSDFRDAVVVLQRGLTPAKALASPQVSVLHHSDPGGLASALANLLTFTAQQFNVVRNLTDGQIELLAADLPSRYWHWRIEEFVYVCREAVAGKWGKVFDRLDPPTVHEWCAAYAAEEQAYAISQAAEQRATAHKQQEVLARADQPTMHKLYLRQQLDRYKPEQWLNLQRWLAQHYPGRNELLEAVSEEDAELYRREQIAAKREAEQRAKARRMLEAFQVEPRRVPNEQDFEQSDFVPLPAFPKGRIPGETEFNEAAA